jgi:hypothetical protein
VFYGDCSGTGLAAIATGSIHALVDSFGMIARAIVDALTYDWVKSHIINVWALGNVCLLDVTKVPDAVWFLGLARVGAVQLYSIEQRARVSCRNVPLDGGQRTCAGAELKNRDRSPGHEP